MGNFFGELRRRKVLRVGVAYVVSSWVLLQVADLLTDILELPDWAPKLVFLILIVAITFAFSVLSGVCGSFVRTSPLVLALYASKYRVYLMLRLCLLVAEFSSLF